MPIIKSAIKAARQTKKRTAHNQSIKKSIKQAFKLFKSNPTPENLRSVQSEYDKAVKKDLLHKNTASRRKSALVKIAKAAGMKNEKADKKAAVASKTPKTTAKTTPKTDKKATVKTETKKAVKTTTKKSTTAKTTKKAA